MAYVGNDPFQNKSVDTAQLADNAVTGEKIVDDITFDDITTTGNVSGSVSSTGSYGRVEATKVEGTLITAAQTNVTSVGTVTTGVWNSSFGTTSGTQISGSITATSSSIATRFDSRETDMTLATASIVSNESNMTLATASIAAITASVSTAKTDISTNSANMTLATASIAAITASVSSLKSTSFAGTAGTETVFSGSVASTGSFGEVHVADKVGIGTAVPDGTGLHIFASSVGSTAHADADDLIIENNVSGEDVGMTILSKSDRSGLIFFGDAESTTIGRIQYDHSSNFMRFDAAGSEKMRISGSNGMKLEDTYGIIFGSDTDYWLGFYAAEGTMQMFKGGTAGAGAEEGLMNFVIGDGGPSYMQIKAGEGSDARLYLYADQGDETVDRWWTAAETNGAYYWRNASNTPAAYLNDAGSLHLDGTVNASNWDYAELFEWKTHLDSDDAVRDLFGMSVVLDGDAVRIAEEGEEDKILGVVRPKGSTGAYGDGLKWQGKFIQNDWGEYEEEGYTMVNWQEFLPNGNASYRHSYPKDEIPQYRLEDGIGRDKGNHTKEENFKLDEDGEKIPVVIPTGSQSEMTASNYVERNYKKNQPDIPLMRRKYADDYDPSIPYIRREDRPREWVLIGLTGQVPVTGSAVIPTHWKKMGTVVSGSIDKYYIFNK